MLLDKDSQYNAIDENGNYHHDENNINIYFTVPEYNKYINVDYKYVLEGFQNQWSDWNTKTVVNLKIYLLRLCFKLKPSLLTQSG
jgi:hypothetical protein